MIQLNDWELELSASSPDSFTSYAGLEMKMIINQMDIRKDFKA